MKTHNNFQVVGGSKRYSIADDVSINATRDGDKWGTFDEDQGFKIWDIPNEFRTQKKFENFKLAKQEEEQGKIILESMPYQIDVEPDIRSELEIIISSIFFLPVLFEVLLIIFNFAPVIFS